MKSIFFRATSMLALLGFGLTRSAAAQLAPASSASADRTFATGLHLLQNGDESAALAAFLSIPPHERTSAVHCNIGLVESGLGHPAESVEALERCFESPVFLSSQTEGEQRRWKALLGRAQKLVGRFSAVANVEGAAVEVDGHLRGKTPLNKPFPMAGGVHEVRVSAPGYVPIVTQVTMKALDQQTVTFDLVRAAKLSISTKLPRAQVVVDGALAGTTPLSTPLELAPGDHDIEVRREGYVSFHAKKKLEAGAEQTLTADIAEDTAWIETHGGSLALTLIEDVPSLWVDGVPRRLEKPSVRLAPGPHHVVVRKDGYEPMEQDIEIEPGATTKVAFRLVPTQATACESRVRFERRQRWGIGLLAGGALMAGAGAGAFGYFKSQMEQPAVNGVALCHNLAANRTACPTYQLGQTLGGVGLGLGGALLVTGAWLWLGNDRSSLDDASRARALAQLPVVPIVGVTPGAPEASLGLLGSF